MNVLLDEDHAIYRVHQVGFALVQESYQVLVGQVAEDPLDPDNVVLDLKLELLEADHVEPADMKAKGLLFDVGRFYISSRLIYLDLAGFNQIDFAKAREKQVLCHAANSSATIEGATMAKPSLELINEAC